MGFIIIGVIGIVLSAILTQHFVKKNGLPTEMTEQLPGTGVIPKWVSLINLAGWALIVWGVISFFIGS